MKRQIRGPLMLMIGQILERDVGVIEEEPIVRVLVLSVIREIAVGDVELTHVISTAGRLFCFSICLPVSFTRCASAC